MDVLPMSWKEESKKWGVSAFCCSEKANFTKKKKLEQSGLVRKEILENVYL